MNDQAANLRNIMNHPKAASGTHFITVTSGKGGVGKSTFSANLANTLAKNGYRVALFDADIGLANLDVILNVRVQNNLLSVLKGECSLKDILIPVKENLTLIPGESGDDIFKYSDQFMINRFLDEASALDGTEFVIIDTGAGISRTTQVFFDVSDEIVVVTVPDPAAITDAYATIKVASRVKKDLFLMMNMAKNGLEARRIFENLKKVASANFETEVNIELLGFLENDKLIARSIKQRSLFTDDAPHIDASMNLKEMASKLLYKMERKVLDGANERNFVSFFKRLVERF